MNMIIKLDEELLDIPYDRIISAIKNSDINEYVKGIELTLNSVNVYDVELFASLLKENNYTLQFKGINLENDIDTHLAMIKLYNKIVKIYDKEILITYTPIRKETLEESIKETEEKLSKILNYIEDNSYRMKIALENVKYSSSMQMYDVLNTSIKLRKLYLSYNIGNEIINGYSSYSLPKEATKLDESKVENVYIYDVTETGIGHYPFTYGNIELYMVFEYLNKIKYTKNIVLDIDMKYLNGRNIEEKIKSYITEINKVGFFKSY